MIGAKCAPRSIKLPREVKPRFIRENLQLRKMSDSDDYDLLPEDVQDDLSTAGSNFFDCLVIILIEKA